jgi:hypothetical protein
MGRKFMGEKTEKTEKQYHPIDRAFFEEWLRIQHGVFTWALWFFNNGQLAQDLLEEALQATTEGRRRWPTNVTLARHLKDAMRSIRRNRKKSLSELRLDPGIERDPHHGTDEELEQSWFEPPVDLDMRSLEHLRNPEELLDDAQGTELAQRMAEEVFDMTDPGSIEQRILLEARKENHETSAVAEALGVEPYVVRDGKRRLRAKVRAVLARHGLTDPKLARKAGKK